MLAGYGVELCRGERLGISDSGESRVLSLGDVSHQLGKRKARGKGPREIDAEKGKGQTKGKKDGIKQVLVGEEDVVKRARTKE